MNRFPSLTSAVVMTLALVGTPAFAQGARSRGGHASSAPSRGGAQAAPRSAPAPRAAAVPRAVPRIVGPGGAVVGPYYGGGYYRPYYAFRPRLNVGFGLWLGYPIGYPYYYPYYYPYGPYGYPYPYAYPPDAPYPADPAPAPSGNVSVTPSSTGGLSFDITPATAEVFVDGQRQGTVADFSPTQPPLALAPGRHTVEIRATGYQSMAFDAAIVAGQVLPYQGTMRPE
jgi:hypothetical protein